MKIEIIDNNKSKQISIKRIKPTCYIKRFQINLTQNNEKIAAWKTMLEEGYELDPAFNTNPKLHYKQ